MKAVILQPAYLPWIGYFGEIDSADVFIFYDDVQFVRQSWQTRNKIKTRHGPLWLTVPVLRRFGQLINQVRINNSIRWYRKHWKSISHNYEKATYFKYYSTLLQEVYTETNKWERLSDLNVSLIIQISDVLKINTKFILASDLSSKGQKTERLVSILDEVGAHEYISGPAAKSYVDVDAFKKAGVPLYWYNFGHPTYPQLFGEFVPYLSVVDLLMNVGNSSLDIIRGSNEDSLRRA